MRRCSFYTLAVACGLALGACGGGGSNSNSDGDAGIPDAAPRSGMSDPAAPKILSLRSNVAMLFPDVTLQVTANVTDPDGITDLIGGQLIDPDTGAAYGPFASQSTGGAYGLSLSWDQIAAVRPLTGTGRKFRAEFFDAAGHSSYQELKVMPACRDSKQAVCDSRCINLDTAQNCGACGKVCAAVTHGVGICQTGSCDVACDTGYVKSGKVCVRNLPKGWSPLPISTGAEPSSRNGHVAAYTGSQMIVALGHDQGNEYADSYAYDPITQAWKQLADLSLPSLGQAAVFTGSNVMVWGGDLNMDVRGINGLLYSPSTNRWNQLLELGSAPRPQHAASLVSIGSEIMLFGGYGASGLAATTPLYFYNPSTSTWRSKVSNSTIAYPLSQHTAVWTGSEVLIWGGDDTDTQGINSRVGWRYNPTSNTWKAMSTTGAPSPRYSHSAVFTGREMVVFGGTDGKTAFSDGGRYNPITDTWAPLDVTAGPKPRAEHTAVWTGEAMIIWGGTANGRNPVPNPAGAMWVP